MRERLIERFKQIKTNIADKLGPINSKLSKKAKIIIAVVAILVIAASFAIALSLNSTEYAVLYTGLEDPEATEVIGILENQGIKYKHQDNTIYVPEETVDKVKVALASEGYPKSGFTYDIFKDNVSLMSTDFEKYKYAQFELENRMAETIKQFDGVKNATVAIAMADEQKYALEEDKQESSASVTVTMEEGGSPSAAQVKGIQRLVAKGVPGMKIENVAVLNGNGEEVQPDDEADAQEGAAALKLKVEKQIEDSIKEKVLHLFQPVFGEDNIRVSVTCSVDLDKKIKEIIEYIPSEDNKGVLSKSTSNYEVQGEGKVTEGVPGTETNADVPVYPGVSTDGKDIYFKDDRSFEYLVSQVKEQVQSDAADLTDTTVSVAVDSASLTPAKAGELRQAIAVAVGVDPSLADTKIAIFNAQFYEPETQQASGFGAVLEKNPALKVIIPAVLALIIALIVVTIVVIRKIRLKKKAEEEVEEELPEIIPETEELVRLDELGKTREEELKGQIQDFTDINPEISAQLLKTWLRGEEENE
ncbi:flagellar basal-body MS-ring/collar protein FliF [Aminipila luticellarii]|uniref:Flagellar M-ring protein FliF n=1 Tax=Aminipila luticellarii TaxID=2507160 RepID=A0A410PSM8_9FIRM|nr:flagellar basal-body MS-ring/collar protein FliF [Aminipila luticellarii]QAT41991.1 flagellar M-ring protein FliF [Aminipila luticellarii]